MPDLRKIYDRFLARKTTVLLIIILTSLYLLGVLIPQKQLLSPENYQAWKQASPIQFALLESLQLTSIYSSPLTLLVTALFFLNLVLVTAKRVPLLIRELKLPERVTITPSICERLEHVTVSVSGTESLETLRKKVAARGYRIVDGDDCFKGFKNNFSMFGSLMFHISFLLILLGALTIFHSRFRGDVYVAEQQSFGGQSQEYRKRMRYSELRKTVPKVEFQVNRIIPKFAGLEPLSLQTELLVTYDGRTVRGTTDVNHPFTSGPLSILISDLGVAPLLRVVDRQGREVLSAFAVLNILRGAPDTFEIPETPYSLRFRFWPDFAFDADGKAISRSYAMKNPRFEVSVYRNGQLIGDRHVLHGADDAIDFDSLRLTIPEIRYYGNFIVVEERGGAILIIGFLLSVCGLILKIFWRKRTVYALYRRDNGSDYLTIACHTEYYQGGASDLNGLVAELGAGSPAPVHNS